jgi:hypothetical protein
MHLLFSYFNCAFNRVDRYVKISKRKKSFEAKLEEVVLKLRALKAPERSKGFRK